MAQNIYNQSTGQYGYQTPGAQLQAGWAWATPTPTATSPGSAITPTSLQPVKALTLPKVAQPTESGNFLATIESSLGQYMQPDETLKTDVATARKSIFDKLFGKKGSSELTTEAYAGTVDPAKKELDDIQNQIRAKSQAYRKQIEGIQTAEGGTTAGAQAAANDLQRKASSELADLSIIEQTKLQNYSTAKEIADRQVSVQLERDKNETDALNFWYTENKDELSKQDDRRFNFMIGERQRLLMEKKDNLDKINTIKLQAAQYGASPEVLKQLSNTSNFDDALQIAGQYLGKEFALKVRAQNFQEQIKGTELATAMSKASQDANKEFSNSAEAKAVSVLRGQVGTVDQLFKNIVGTSDRQQITDAQWSTLSKDSSAVEAIANAEVRARNPEISRLAEAGDLAAEKSLTDQVNQFAKQYGGGSAASIKNMKQAIRVIDSAYQFRLTEAQKVLANFQTLYPGSTIYTTYNGVNIPQNASKTPNYNGVIMPF